MDEEVSIKRKLDIDDEAKSKIIKLEPCTQRINQHFFNVPCDELASALLGMILARKFPDGEIIKGRIVETECYPGGYDKASHSYMGKRTDRNEAMYMDPGTAYVYITYGMYYCCNISSAEPGGAVLIRAVEPIQGIQTMLKLRTDKRKEHSKPLREEEICNGPSKLCTALGIDKTSCNKLDLCTSHIFWVEKDEQYDEPKCVIRTNRVGVESAGQIWAGKHLRFYVFGNVHVSQRDKKREKETLDNLLVDITS